MMFNYTEYWRILFLTSLSMLIYVYFGYPLIVWVLSLFINRKIEKGTYEPRVTILIAAYNEEKDIEQTIKNKLELEYPKEKLEIILISDGSTDSTDEIVRRYGQFGIKLIRQERRSGKTAAINLGVQNAGGEVIIFSDANSIYKEDAIQKLVRNFMDPSVGYVTGNMIYTKPDGTTVGDGCTVYMKYENFLRSIETKIGSVVGVDGGIDAIRKSLYRSMEPDQLPDFVLPLKVIDGGYRVIYEPEAVLKEPALKNPNDEYRMRVRVSLRALWGLLEMRQLLDLKKFGLFAWQLWSHKVLRYLCFVFLCGAYFGNLALWHGGPFYRITYIVQNIAYLGAISNLLFEKKGYPIRLFYSISYFMLLNLAAGHAFVKFLSGQKQVIWTPRKG